MCFRILNLNIVSLAAFYELSQLKNIFISSCRLGNHEPNEILPNDPEEAKLDYWREDAMLHVFHSLWHKLTLGRRRPVEYFVYAHQQMLRR